MCLEQINYNCGNKVLTSRPNKGEGGIVVQPTGHHLIIRISEQLQVEKNMHLCVTYCRKNEKNVILFLINIVQFYLFKSNEYKHLWSLELLLCSVSYQDRQVRLNRA